MCARLAGPHLQPLSGRNLNVLTVGVLSHQSPDKVSKFFRLSKTMSLIVPLSPHGMGIPDRPAESGSESWQSWSKT